VAYPLSIDINLGAGNAGLTLTPALFDSANSAAAGLTTSTMVEVAASSGSYLWTGTIPDGHRGYISFSSGATFKTKVVLNGQEVENPNIKTSNVWEELRSVHLTPGTYGRSLQIIRNGTAQGGGASTITLDAGASSIDNFYNNTILFIVSGTGAGQSRFITGYVGATQVATVAPWAVVPDNTANWGIYPFDSIPGAVAPTASANAAAVWASASRTLTAFAFTVDILQSAADKVWASAARTLTSFGTLTTDTAAAVWAAGTRTLTSAGLTAADVWNYVTRTLTQSIAAVTPPPVISGSVITVLRGETILLSFTGLGSLTGRTKLWFTYKSDTAQADTQAIIQVEETAGLIYLNGNVASAGQGSLVVTDATSGSVTVTLTPAASLALLPGPGRYDVQMGSSGVIRTLTGGVMSILGDVTRAVS